MGLLSGGCGREAGGGIIFEGQFAFEKIMVWGVKYGWENKL